MSRKITLYTCVRYIAELLSLCLIPALLYGCSSDPVFYPSLESEEYSVTEIRLKSDSEYSPSHTDVFIFNNDALMRIDAYQRVEGLNFKAASRVGEKIVVAISNSLTTMDEWRKISSYGSLMEEIAYLSEEDADEPLMSGQMEITAGAVETYELDMKRLMSKIEIRTLCADFHSTEYDGEPLTDAKVYLTNVNASCAIMKEENFRPEMIVNFGRLDYTSLADFRSGNMLWSEIPFNLTASAIPADISLYCYPNNAEEETYGSPFTRLVIEGKIRGITCYYPITINREENGVCFGGEGDGIGRNCLYTFDITLCRFGTSDPDTPVSKGDVIVSCTIEPWTEKDSQTIIY